MQWTDSHCHLPSGADADEVVAEARAAGVFRMLNVGTDAASSAQAVKVAGRYDGIWATVGVHPHEATDGVDAIVEMLGEPGVVAVGECGLDYHYDHSPRAVQRDVFAQQIQLALEHDLALVIHTREAWEDTFAILGFEGIPNRTVFHCFTGGPSEATRGLEMGIALSFSGIVTFPSADDVRAAAKLCPLDMMLVETDSPYLAPVPHRGKPNRPALVTHVGNAVAALKRVPTEVVARETSLTAERIFHLN